ncbi:hypothetical protein APH_0253 [Anaplasma phagocytophilum str. HZ]|uniref:Uncharacterized protein n=1 Tax=Anaplasma phagocytophilum (strain HZ) TaxID=212042 RepID=Q2GL83_ANAPZ|nr:hypothetical protein APH_0253 [Anaplasma phagocytophilum str. HZ]
MLSMLLAEQQVDSMRGRYVESTEISIKIANLLM